MIVHLGVHMVHIDTDLLRGLTLHQTLKLLLLLRRRFGWARLPWLTTRAQLACLLNLFTSQCVLMLLHSVPLFSKVIFVSLGSIGLSRILCHNFVIFSEKSLLQFVVCCRVALDIRMTSCSRDGTATWRLFSAYFLLFLLGRSLSLGKADNLVMLLLKLLFKRLVL
jgi:hypothetical protein